jgi:hypothetical protein
LSTLSRQSSTVTRAMLLLSDNPGPPRRGTGEKGMNFIEKW